MRNSRRISTRYLSIRFVAPVDIFSYPPPPSLCGIGVCPGAKTGLIPAAMELIQLSARRGPLLHAEQTAVSVHRARQRIRLPARDELTIYNFQAGQNLRHVGLRAVSQDWIPRGKMLALNHRWIEVESVGEKTTFRKGSAIGAKCFKFYQNVNLMLIKNAKGSGGPFRRAA